MLDANALDALFFDLDGTLLDTDDQAVEAFARWLGRLRLKSSQRLARRIVMALETPGNAFLTMLDVVGLDGPLAGFTAYLHRLRGLRSPSNFRMVAGTEPAIRRLAEGYRLAVVTTRGRRDAQAFLQSFELQDLFEVVVTRESTRRLKPHPAPVLHAAQTLGVPVQRCVMVGDTTVDVRSAVRAGAWAVAVLCGFGERKELERVGAHLVLSSPAELPTVFGVG